MNGQTILTINKQDQVTLSDLVITWLTKETKFTSVPWQDPQSSLSAADYAKVCLIDMNEPGEEKVKSKLKLPIRSRPDGPINTNALRAVAAALGGARGNEIQAPEEAKTKAARTVVRLMREAGIEPGEATLNRAGLAKADLGLEVEIIKADAKEQIVYGIPLVPDTEDGQGDTVTPPQIARAAWGFMLKSQRFDFQHERLVPIGEAAVVESYIAPVDFDLNGKSVKAGSWVLATKIFSKELWARIEKGEINAYSINGRGSRRPT